MQLGQISIYNKVIALILFDDITSNCVGYYLLKDVMEDVWEKHRKLDIDIPEIITQETGWLGFDVGYYEYLSKMRIVDDNLPDLKYLPIITITKQQTDYLKVNGKLLLE